VGVGCIRKNRDERELRWKANKNELFYRRRFVFVRFVCLPEHVRT